MGVGEEYQQLWRLKQNSEFKICLDGRVRGSLATQETVSKQKAKGGERAPRFHPSLRSYRQLLAGERGSHFSLGDVVTDRLLMIQSWLYIQSHAVNINGTWWAINESDMELGVRWSGGSQGELEGGSRTWIRSKYIVYVYDISRE